MCSYIRIVRFTAHTHTKKKKKNTDDKKHSRWRKDYIRHDSYPPILYLWNWIRIRMVLYIIFNFLNLFSKACVQRPLTQLKQTPPLHCGWECVTTAVFHRPNSHRVCLKERKKEREREKNFSYTFWRKDTSFEETPLLCYFLLVMQLSAVAKIAQTHTHAHAHTKRRGVLRYSYI